MLIMNRKLGESICIGEVVLKVLDRRGLRIELGIDAPLSIRVVRDDCGKPPPADDTPQQGKFKPK